MKKSIEIVGLPLFSITEGREIGVVSGLVVDASLGSIAAVTIDDGKWYLGAKILPFSAISGIGDSAVTVESSTAIISVTAAPALLTLLESGVKVIGTKVLTNKGQIQGIVREILIDEQGKISDLEVETDGQVNLFSTQRVYTFGPEVTVIGTETVKRVVQPVQVQVTEDFSDVILGDQLEVTIPAVQTIEAPQKKTDDKHRKYLVGKKASKRIQTDNGAIIVDEGGEITEEVVQKAKLAGKFVELSMNIQ